jgi:hypothetical protein
MALVVEEDIRNVVKCFAGRVSRQTLSSLVGLVRYRQPGVRL